MESNQISSTEVSVAIALNEHGDTKCIIIDENRLNSVREYSEFVSSLTSSKYLWTIKRIKVKIPYPLQYEDLTK